MTDVVMVWNDQTESVSDAFSDKSEFDLNQLQDELLVEQSNLGLTYNPSATKLWRDGVETALAADSIYCWIDASYSSLRQTALETVVSNHVPVAYEMAPRKQYSGTTDANGEFVVTFDLPYRTQPEMYMETPEVEGQSNYIPEASKSTTGCTCLVTEENSSFVALIGITVVEPASPAQGAHVTLTVFNNDI